MSDAVALCKCGATETRPEDSTRCRQGHTLVGHPGPAFKHGVRAFEARGESALPSVLRDTVDAFREQVVADRGGADNLTAIEGGYIRRLAELEAVVRLLAGDLAQRGLFTPRGRVRGTLGQWMQALDRWNAYAAKVGIERKARPVSPFDAVRAAVEEANKR